MSRAGIFLTTLTVLASLAGIAGAAVAVHRWYCPVEPAAPIVVPVPIPEPTPTPDPTPEGPRRKPLWPWRPLRPGDESPP